MAARDITILAMGELVVRRDTGFGTLRSYTVIVNGQKRGRVRWRSTLRCAVPDGPVMVQAWMSWSGSAVWRGHAGPEPTHVVISSLDPIRGIVDRDDALLVTEDKTPLSATQQQSADAGRRRTRRFSVLWSTSVVFLIALFTSLLVGHHLRWAFGCTAVYSVLLIVWVAGRTDARRPSTHDRGHE